MFEIILENKLIDVEYVEPLIKLLGILKFPLQVKFWPDGIVRPPFAINGG